MSPDRAAPAGETIAPAAYGYLQRLVLGRTGIVVEDGKEYLAEARLHAIARSEGLGSVAALLEALQTEERTDELHRRVVEAMLNGETSFFRDYYPFEALREVVIPELIAKRSPSRTLNVWCAAVASGQEAYSLAMLVSECFPHLGEWNLRILATDVSESMLERARGGRYRQLEVNRGLPAPYLVKYFRQRDSEWIIADAPRRLVQFSQLNLAAVWPPLPPMDVILMRNVLLYFSSETRRTIYRKVAASLRPDGYLIVGGGETALALERDFEAVRIGKTVCYRVRPAGDRAT
ncbi:MAG TPA: CheR family methyltransferase [Candidatus Eisenbacteria bacterium]